MYAYLRQGYSLRCLTIQVYFCQPSLSQHSEFPHATRDRVAAPGRRGMRREVRAGGGTRRHPEGHGYVTLAARSSDSVCYRSMWIKVKPMCAERAVRYHVISICVGVQVLHVHAYTGTSSYVHIHIHSLHYVCTVHNSERVTAIAAIAAMHRTRAYCYHI